MYVAARKLNQVQLWTESSSEPTIVISKSLTSPYSLFVVRPGDIYVDNGKNGWVEMRHFATSVETVVLNVEDYCFDLFVDQSDTLYCSLVNLHQVVKKLSGRMADGTIIAAGNRVQGSTANTLSYPEGLFVDLDENLYVADCGNDRVQRFAKGQLIGMTVVSGAISGSCSLSCPNGIVLDADSYLFISDQNKNRIVRSGPDGCRCLIGCSEVQGAVPHQLSYPAAIHFDSYGNLFVADQGNSRIQKFLFLESSCSKCSIPHRKPTFWKQIRDRRKTMFRNYLR